MRIQAIEEAVLRRCFGLSDAGPARESARTLVQDAIALPKPFHEPARSSNSSLAWEGGTEDARTPDPSRRPGVSEAREAFGVRPIYRRFPSGAGRPRFMVPMHGREAEGALLEPTHPPNSSQEGSL